MGGAITAMVVITARVIPTSHGSHARVDGTRTPHARRLGVYRVNRLSVSTPARAVHLRVQEVPVFTTEDKRVGETRFVTLPPDAVIVESLTDRWSAMCALRWFENPLLNSLTPVSTAWLQDKRARGDR